MSEIATRTASQELVAVVRSDQFVEQIALALPETVSPRRFARIAITAIQQNPDLALCTRDSVTQALLRCAADGLLPDGREAAIVKRGDKASYMPMVDGYKKAAADYGWTLRGRVVHENDTFDYSEEPPVLTHTPTRPGLDPGPMVCAYSIATHHDGRRLQRVMNTDEIGQRRAMATTDQVWKKWPAQMWEKTAIRDLFKDLPLGDLDRERMQRVLDADSAFERAAQDPAAALYGQGREDSAANSSDKETADGAAGPNVRAGDTGGAEAGRGGGVAARTGSAPAPATDEAEDAVWDPIDEPEPAAPSAGEIEKAGQTVVPRGVHQGRTLADVAKLDDGPAWLLTQLKKLNADAPARPAIELVVRYALPDTWAAYTAWKETQ